MPELTTDDFARAFGVPPETLPAACQELIGATDFSYTVPMGNERDVIVLDVMKKIAGDSQVIGADDRKDVWYRGWQENLSDFIDSGYDPESLIPKFIRPDQVVRLHGDYACPANPCFELDYITVLRTWLFHTYLKEAAAVYEFGCGTGFNLMLLYRLFPGKRLLHGLDFVQSSVDLVNEIGRRCSLPLQGHLFDMLAPDRTFDLASDCAVFTFGALEQLAGRFEKFLQYLLEQKPELCFHIEPTVELYDENILVDYLAACFHRKRGYTQGFLPRLQTLSARGEIELLKVQRLYFGSLFMEGYMLLVWRPL